jgi:hypothetical protein
MKGLLYSEDSSFYINGLRISGVSSIDGNYNIQYQENTFLGYEGSPDLVQNSPASASFNIDRTMISSDKPIVDLIGDTGFDGGIEYNGKVLNFESGFLNSYTISFSVDEIPQTNIGISVYGEMGPDARRQDNKPVPTGIFVPSSSGISINCDGRETNRVLNFSFTINPKRQPIYKIGSIYPCEVAYIKPIQNSFSVEMDVDDYETKNVYDYIKTGIHQKSITVTVRDSCETGKYIEYNFEKFHLVGEGFQADVSNNTKVRLDYAMSSNRLPLISYSDLD